MNSTLFIRADAGPTMGIGHFMRMLALAEGWLASGGAVVFGGDVPEALVPRATKLGARFAPRAAPAQRLSDAQWTVAQARAANADVVVADGYHFGLDFQEHVAGAGLKLLVVDDNGENHAYAANWVLNLNVHANEAMYARRPPACELLLGTQYVLLRGSIRRHTKAVSCDRVTRVLVTFGGADPANATGLILSALPKGLDVRVLIGAANPRAVQFPQAEVDVEDVAPVMAWADVGVCAPSTTCWELAHLGVPALALSLADNQVAIGERLNELGALRLLGDARRPPQVPELTAAIEAFLENRPARDQVIRAATQLVDGAGVDRVVTALGRRHATL